MRGSKIGEGRNVNIMEREDGSHHRRSRREYTWAHHQEDRARKSDGLRSARDAHSEAMRDVREEGEVKELEKPQQQDENA
ncbi:hypothetical protein F2Q68_00045470 [Brassica cretica]|uniref:Uncharacterized protein n=1 Tax=Brassica cretica TaxID=69181 RepID=A0A8S9LSL6_BRACR|nr:hypothetical protein F2Q68_00045470 [Brassica cretica]